MISVDPSNQSAFTSDYLTISVNASNVSELYGFQLDLGFDQALLEFNSISEGGFLNEGNPSNTFCTLPDLNQSGQVNGYACTRLVSGNVSGGGDLAFINFSVLGEGSGQFSLTGIKFSDVYANPLAFSSSDGEFTSVNCTDGDEIQCGPDNETGICGYGTRTCSGGVFGACQGATYPAQETCNSQDDDCDGETDEGVCAPPPEDDDDGGSGGGSPGGGGFGCTEGQTRDCSGSGVCEPATQTCSGGVWGPCTGDREPTQEICNGIDDDCDGEIDEDGDCCDSGETRDCGPAASQGECMRGTATCQNGVWGDCIGAIYPAVEMCDGLDNDCDGQVDNECISEECPEGQVSGDGCLCGGDRRTSGFCCSGIWYETGCPFEWGYLMVIGVLLLVCIFAYLIFFKKGQA